MPATRAARMRFTREAYVETVSKHTLPDLA